MKVQLLVLGTKVAKKTIDEQTEDGLRVFFVLPGEDLAKDADGLTPLSGFLKGENVRQLFAELPGCYHAELKICERTEGPEFELFEMSFATPVHLFVGDLGDTAA